MKGPDLGSYAVNLKIAEKLSTATIECNARREIRKERTIVNYTKQR